MQMGRQKRGARRARWGAAFVVLCSWNLSLIGCDRAPREPTEPSTSPTPQAPDPSPSPAPAPSPDPAPAPEPRAAEEDACVVPLADPPPPEVGPVSDCPEDPQGRPEMPYGTVSFPEAEAAPTLRVELAVSPRHRTHGLMYRPALADDEGMLFSWPSEQKRSFWMQNTCLALDMLFVQEDGTISKILENVPPMNTEKRRSDPCAVAHVLEVRAGWSRTYGVEPGQKMLVGPAEN